MNEEQIQLRQPFRCPGCKVEREKPATIGESIGCECARECGWNSDNLDDGEV